MTSGTRSYSPPKVEVRDTESRKGLGVYAARAYHTGDVVERSPVVVFDLPAVGELPHEICVRMFNWQWLIDGSSGRQAIALGYGSLYNHGKVPNLRYVAVEGTHTLEFIALNDIAAGDELTIDYDQGSPCGMRPDERWAARHKVELE